MKHKAPQFELRFDYAQGEPFQLIPLTSASTPAQDNNATRKPDTGTLELFQPKQKSKNETDERRNNGARQGQ